MPSREENVTELNNNNIIQYEAGELVCKIFLFRSNDFATIVNVWLTRNGGSTLVGGSCHC